MAYSHLKIVLMQSLSKILFITGEKYLVNFLNKFTIQDFDNYANTAINSLFVKEIKKELLNNQEECNRIPTLLPIDTKTFQNLLIIPRIHGKKQIYLANGKLNINLILKINIS